MVRAAVADQPGLVVDDREIRREGPSWTVLTLRELRAASPTLPLCLILGMDAFLGLPQWHEWRSVLELAHVVVAHRPGWTAPTDGTLGELVAARRTGRVADLHETPAGRIHVRPVTQLEISSTELRELIVAGRDPRYLLPDSVRAIIQDTGCYQPRPTR
jgi:nicotinate-nucleotide adenylyltransferase